MTFALWNVGTGFIISILLTHFVLPHWGYVPSVTSDVTVTGIYTLAALARNYINVRLFKRYGWL